jgi:O-acetylhomoserine (thiol)-lyase
MTMQNISERQLGFTTRQLHAGYVPEATTGARAVPIYQTTAYNLQSTERAARLFALRKRAISYPHSNPTHVLEQRIADLEGGAGAVEVSSGHAARAFCHLCDLRAGDHRLGGHLYGRTVSQFKFTFPRLGIDVTFVDPTDAENFRRHSGKYQDHLRQRRWATAGECLPIGIANRAGISSIDDR